jgi:hypothetical protein
VETIMPRIPAAIAVVMLVATCIGFNTARFPVVLEMAAVPGASSQPKGVAHSDSSTESSDSTSDADDSYSSSYQYGQASDDDGSSWSDYDNDSDNSYGDSYSSYAYDSRGSYDSEDDEYDYESNNEPSNDSSYGYSYGESDDTDSSNYSSYGSSYGESDDGSSGSSTYGYSYDESDDNDSSNYSSRGSSYGKSDDDDSSNYSSYGYGRSSEDEAGGSKPNRRKKDRSPISSNTMRSAVASTGVEPESPESEESYSWSDRENDESEHYSEYEPPYSNDTDTEDDGSYAYSDPYDGGSAEDRVDESSGSYGYSSSGFGYGRDSYDNDTDFREDETDVFDNDNRHDRSRGDSYAGVSLYGNDSLTRYDERHEAAAEKSSAWSGGAPVTASPTGPYAYGSDPYEASAAVSADVTPDRGSLGLVPIEDTPRSSSSWNDPQPGKGTGLHYGAGHQGVSQRPSFSAGGVVPLPPVDETVAGPVLSPLADGSIPLYPSTGAR